MSDYLNLFGIEFLVRLAGKEGTQRKYVSYVLLFRHNSFYTIVRSNAESKIERTIIIRRSLDSLITYSSLVLVLLGPVQEQWWSFHVGHGFLTGISFTFIRSLVDLGVIKA